MKVGIFYGSSTGNTKSAANQIAEGLRSLGQIEVRNIAEAGLEALIDYDLVVLGTSTWGMGDVQDGWVGLETFSGVDLSDKKVALFGTGDQVAYPDTFVDALGTLADAAEQAGGTLIGHWPTEGYTYHSSTAERDNYFVGLVLDEDNQSDLTEERIQKWTAQVCEEVREISSLHA